MGIEHADGVEMLSEFVFPLIQITGFVPLAVNNCHAGTTGETEDIHLGLVNLTEGARPVHDVNNASSMGNGVKQLAVVS